MGPDVGPFQLEVAPLTLKSTSCQPLPIPRDSPHSSPTSWRPSSPPTFAGVNRLNPCPRLPRPHLIPPPPNRRPLRFNTHDSIISFTDTFSPHPLFPSFTSQHGHHLFMQLSRFAFALAPDLDLSGPPPSKCTQSPLPFIWEFFYAVVALVVLAHQFGMEHRGGPAKRSDRRNVRTACSQCERLPSNGRFPFPKCFGSLLLHPSPQKRRRMGAQAPKGGGGGGSESRSIGVRTPRLARTGR